MLPLRNRIVQGFYSAPFVYMCVCVFTLSVSALQFTSIHPSAGGRVILFVPKCESATIEFNLTLAATFLPSCQ